MTVHFEGLVAGFSRYHKYTLGTELREGSRAVLQQVLRANNAASRQPRAAGSRAAGAARPHRGFAAGHARGQGSQGFQEFRRLPACRGAGRFSVQTERRLVQAHAGLGQSPCKRQNLRMWISRGPEWPPPCRAVQPAGAGQRAEFHHRASTPPGLLRCSLRRAGMFVQATVPGSAGSVAGGPAACVFALVGEVGGLMCSPTTTGPVRSTRRIRTTRGTSIPTTATSTPDDLARAGARARANYSCPFRSMS